MMTPDILAAVATQAAAEYPRECCGLVVVVRGKRRYVPCRNLAGNNEHFVLDPADYARAEDMGEIVAVAHSHPNIPPVPSDADRVGCERSGLPWLIMNWPTGAWNVLEPSGYKAPLIGREFQHGILDCFSLIQDYYREVAGIALDTPDRADEWWLKGDNLYLDNYAAWGFTPVDTPRLHDVLLMQVASPVPNHGAIWLGDGNILHHQMGRLSSRDVYGGWYRKIHTHTLRHRSLLP